MEKQLLLKVANTMWQQILWAGINVAMSWGVQKRVALERRCSGDVVLPCLALKVSGLLHTGWVIVGYDYNIDTYEVGLLDDNGKAIEDWHTDVYCDDLGTLIDSLVERPLGMSDDEYFSKAMEDSDKKCKEYYEEI